MCYGINNVIQWYASKTSIKDSSVYSCQTGILLLLKIAKLYGIIMVVTSPPFQVQQKLNAVRGKFKQLKSSLASKWEKVGAYTRLASPHNPGNEFLICVLSSG